VHDNLYLWDIAAISGATSFKAANGVTTSVNSLTGLSINAPAFDLFAKSLGLTPAGSDALKTVTDFGKIDSTISVTTSIAATPAVPEASSMAYALMGLGVVGFIAARRRAVK